jgi:voltage-gated potassium channel
MVTAKTMSRVVHWERDAAAARVAFLVAYVWPMLDPQLLAFVRALNRTAAGSLAGRATAYVIGLAVGAVGLGSVAMLDAEWGAPKTTITTFGDAL